MSSITASVTLERSLSEVASFSVSGAKLRAPAAIALLAKLWLITGEENWFLFRNQGVKPT